jgi:hypothetical protein
MAQPVASAAGALGPEVRARHVTETHDPEPFAHNAAWSANYEATEDRAAATGDDIGLGGRGQPRSTGPRPAVPRIDHPATGCVHGRCPPFNGLAGQRPPRRRGESLASGLPDGLEVAELADAGGRQLAAVA